VDAGKLTYPGVLGLEASTRAISDLLARAEAAVAPFGIAGEPLANLARYMAVRTK
jgi:geranylgeranyl diphosphate synthase, type II